MKKVLVALVVVTALLVFAASASSARAPQAQAQNAKERFLVGFERAPAAAERALVARAGGIVRREIPEASALAVELPAQAVQGLQHSRGVAYVEEDALRYPYGLATTQLTPSLSNGLYGLVTTKATTAHSRGVTGSGVKACVADTGLDYTHPDISGRYAGGIDTVASPDDTDPWWNGDPEEVHGTHVAGTVLASNDTQGVFGVAYGATLYHARVLGPSGGYSSDIMAGVRWLVEKAGCRVVNMSLGGGFKSRTEETFYNEMDTKGALIVAATGNDSATKISFPAGYASVLAVGAVDVNNAHASFSNTGRNIDISAPGVLVLSAVGANTGSEASVHNSSGTEYRAFGLEYGGKTNGITATLVDCGLGQAGECPATVRGNVALIQRGTISFADKVTNAQNAGAVAAIIYNNAAGDFTGTLGAAGNWIPGVTVSDTAGASLRTQVGQGITVIDALSSWTHMDGTSMATPHVSGVAALVFSANPALADDTVEDYLKRTATDLGAAGYDTTYGYGLVNADAAVARAGR